MRFLVDECTGPILAQWLRDQSHEVFSVYDDARGMDVPTMKVEWSRRRHVNSSVGFLSYDLR